MAIEPDKAAGMALAALLADDRDLAHVATTLAEESRLAARARLDLARTHESGVRALLALLRPELDERALALPARMRSLLARFAPPALRRQLAQDAPTARGEFGLDEELLAVLLRIARSTEAGPRATPPRGAP